MQTPLDGDPLGHVSCDAYCEANPYVNSMTDACENITLPQTSFEGSVANITLTGSCHGQLEQGASYPGADNSYRGECSCTGPLFRIKNTRR